ncbi:MAG: sugar transferase [Myxococcota bacterium]|nr:sugar transferase [Myxococcota bacterium]
MLARIIKSRRLKRVVDIGIAAAGLTVSSPIVAAAALAIRVSMGSPVLFVQERPGLHGRPFKLRKFRTMRDEPQGAPDGERLTRLGLLLRTTSIDELPTLLNVLHGDMSLVGPRPLLTRYLDRYSDRQARRHEVPPGLTGLAQVRGRNSLTWEQKFDLDIWYVDNWSLLLDARILVETAWSVLMRHGISAAGHATMPEFLGNDHA